MLHHRVSALERVLVFIVGLALAAIALCANAQLAHAMGPNDTTWQEQSAFESRDALPTDHVQAGEQLPLVCSSLRSGPRPPAAGSALVVTKRGELHSPPADALRWSDVIQCRRLGGALLLGFATPPPAHS